MDDVLSHVELVLLVHGLSDDGASSLGVRVLLARHPCSATDAVVALLLDLHVLAVEQVGLGAEHPGDTDEGEEEKADLYECLSRVKLVSGSNLFVLRVSDMSQGRTVGWYAQFQGTRTA